MAPHSSTLAWRIPWTEGPGRLQSRGRWGSDTTVRLHFHFSLSCIGEGNGNPLQCSCLENPRDGMGEPGGLPSMGSHRIRHDWSDLAEAAAQAHSCTWSLPCHLHPVVPLKKPGCSLKCLDELLHRPPSSAQWNSVPQPVAQPLSPGTQKCQDTCEERKWSF